MNTQQMRQTIATMIADDRRSERAAAIIRAGAANLGIKATSEDIGQAVTFVREYVQEVPALIDATLEAARKKGVSEEVNGLLEGAARYWFEPHDVLPDHNGLVGLLDDAYVVLSVIATMSSNYQSRTGSPLIDLDLRPMNAGARQLIGEPFATHLDMTVNGIMQGPTVQAFLNAVLMMGAHLGTLRTPPHPIWGNASTDDIVKTQLGMMGIV